MVDTHCHLYVEEFDPDRQEVIKRAQEAGISRFYLPAIDSFNTAAMLAMEEQFPGICYAMAGLHPCSVKENYLDELQQIREQLQRRKFAGIGETGLDYYWDKSYIKEQEIALRMQVDWALEYNLPIILHTRESTQATIDVIKDYTGSGLKGIFHCFGGTLNEASQIINLGFLLGIGGVLTYKNSGLAQVLEHIDLSNMVLETDSPYLAPVPFRGKRNESSYLVHIAEKLAEVKNVNVEVIKTETTKNALSLFERPMIDQ